jgi:hypothetical protein
VKINWTDRMYIDDISHAVEEEMNILFKINVLVNVG